MNTKPSILIIENSIDVTGALVSIIRSSSDLRDFFDFTFVIPAKSKARQYIAGNGFQSIVELPMKELNKRISSWIIYIPYLLVNAIRLKRIIRSKSVSIVHVNDLYNLLPVVLQIIGIRVKYVCHIRFLPNRFPKWLFSSWLNLHLRYSSKIIVVSSALKDALPSHSKIVHIPNELPAKESYPVWIDRSDKPSRTFLYLSNFINGKGQNYALTAFSQIHHKIPQWKLRFVGGDLGLEKNRMFLEDLKKKADEMEISAKIEWVEFTSDVEIEYKESDIVLNFSESESFSITCLEAQYYGRPVIATDCGGPVEIVDHEKTGLIVRNKDIDSMSRAMLELSIDLNRQNQMSSLARQTVRIKFSKENTIDRVFALYREVLCI